MTVFLMGRIQLTVGDGGAEHQKGAKHRLGILKRFSHFSASASNKVFHAEPEDNVPSLFKASPHSQE